MEGWRGLKSKRFPFLLHSQCPGCLLCFSHRCFSLVSVFSIWVWWSLSWLQSQSCNSACNKRQFYWIKGKHLRPDQQTVIGWVGMLWVGSNRDWHPRNSLFIIWLVECLSISLHYVKWASTCVVRRVDFQIKHVFDLIISQELSCWFQPYNSQMGLGQEGKGNQPSNEKP